MAAVILKWGNLRPIQRRNNAKLSKPLLEIKNLKTYFYTDEGISKAVDGVDLVLNRGEILGIIGESGSGKSVTALSIIRLIASPPGKIISGKIWFEGNNLLEKSADEIRRIRGNEISIIFQEPMTSLNPVLTIGDQIMENIITHQKLNKPRAGRPSKCSNSWVFHLHKSVLTSIHTNSAEVCASGP
jgi:ABC-type dipeptide/oligopeptide/nickel transport system ATPase component